MTAKIKASTIAIANLVPPIPSKKPTVAARAVTVAECDDGMPPDPTSCSISHSYGGKEEQHMRLLDWPYIWGIIYHPPQNLKTCPLKIDEKDFSLKMN